MHVNCSVYFRVHRVGARPVLEASAGGSRGSLPSADPPQAPGPDTLGVRRVLSTLPEAPFISTGCFLDSLCNVNREWMLFLVYLLFLTFEKFSCAPPNPGYQGPAACCLVTTARPGPPRRDGDVIINTSGAKPPVPLIGCWGPGYDGFLWGLLPAGRVRTRCRRPQAPLPEMKPLPQPQPPPSVSARGNRSPARPHPCPA